MERDGGAHLANRIVPCGPRRDAAGKVRRVGGEVPRRRLDNDGVLHDDPPVRQPGCRPASPLGEGRHRLFSGARLAGVRWWFAGGPCRSWREGRIGVVQTCVVPTRVVPGGSLGGVVRRSAFGVVGLMNVGRPGAVERSIACLAVVARCVGGRRCVGCGCWTRHDSAPRRAMSPPALMGGIAVPLLASWCVARAWSGQARNDAGLLPVLSERQGLDLAGSQRLGVPAALFASAAGRWHGSAAFVLRLAAAWQGVVQCRSVVVLLLWTALMARSSVVRGFRVDSLLPPCARVARAARWRDGWAREHGFGDRGNRCAGWRRVAPVRVRLVATAGRDGPIEWRAGASDQAGAAVGVGMRDGGAHPECGAARRGRGASPGERCSSGRRSAGRSGEPTAMHSADTTFDSRIGCSDGCGRRSERRSRLAAGSRRNRCSADTVSQWRHSALPFFAATGSVQRSVPGAPSRPRSGRVPHRQSAAAARRRRGVRWVPGCAPPTIRRRRPPEC